ncbi:unnamed protein product [Rhizoctonia solani]|uniref:DUF6533 domain-containing protein n=1 Tax=Rhizoctonia solani TaxID=456999 RepID=A0A8H3H1J5_9AGAM|nr:unnamed protein product [Rhizoctonia solani]
MAFSPDGELDLAELYYATEDTKYLALALCVILICETLTTLPAEVRHVWNSRWSFGRIMFHANRIWAPIMLGIYVPSLFMYNLSEKVRYVFYRAEPHTFDPGIRCTPCLAYWLFYIYGSVVIQIIVAGVLIARIWAIYQLRVRALVYVSKHVKRENLLSTVFHLRALCFGCILLSAPSIVLLQLQASVGLSASNPRIKGLHSSFSGCTSDEKSSSGTDIGLSNDNKPTRLRPLPPTIRRRDDPLYFDSI